MSLDKQVQDWLRRSLLTQNDLPGQLNSRRNERAIWFYDIDGDRFPKADVVRTFTPESGFAADIERSAKYLSPIGEPGHMFYPQCGKKLNWRVLAKDVKCPALYAEGPAKAACAAKLDFPTAGIQGCWGWTARKHGLLMLPEFNDWEFKDRDTYWIPDHDRKPKSVADVLRASNAFALLLKERGAKVRVVWLPLLDGFDKVGLDDFLFHYSRGGKDLPAARRALKELLADAPLWEDYELTEPGNSRRWVSMYGNQFRHIAAGKGGNWRVYKGGCWRDDGRLERLETAKEMFEGLFDDARHGGQSKRFDFLRKHVTRARIENVLELAKSDPTVAITSDRFDRNPLLINCKNCVLEMPARNSNSELIRRPHSPADLLTRQVTVAYDPSAKCRTFLRALNFWTGGDKELQRAIQQLLGISLTGVTHEQVFIILYGPGQTGKSTLIEIARSIAGNYSKTFSSDTFLLRRHGLPEERKLAGLPGIRLASSSETEQSGILDENLIKLLTGEDAVTGRRLYEEQFEFAPEAKFWIRTNNKPAIRSLDNSIWRRVVAIPFGRIVSEEKKDPQLKDKLRKELKGILAWMVEGYLDYARNGLCRAEAVEKAKEDYQKESDILGMFFEEKCEFAPHYQIGRGKLEMAFAQWCVNNNRRVTRGRELYQQITTRWKDRVSAARSKRDANNRQEHIWKGLTTKTDLFRDKPVGETEQR